MLSGGHFDPGSEDTGEEGSPRDHDGRRSHRLQESARTVQTGKWRGQGYLCKTILGWA